MRKRQLKAKLALAKETLKDLDSRNAEGVVGGGGGGTIQPGITHWPACTNQDSVCLC